ncbi:PD-(D/E)XK nuclease family protein [Micromonospora sp. WMMA1363]|uniref:PD-(D/E)XK nuclease family protein n=1 Tax=Micromonospora sp. WMMA1363 TaxID=3053985 RepID=UPI00259CF6BA|nr:PD-(D/E)XK nuclease family protein [Micromonospora sp. WMMA1363]MDM4718421.1 PD-(D/E)XK nuclease family protein [Micromonospora sp. WMMA1363]
MSQLQTFSKCGEQWRLEKRVLAPSRPAAWCHQGTAFHTAVEAWERNYRQDHPGDILDLFETEYDRLVAVDMEREPDLARWLTGGNSRADADITRRRERGATQVQGYMDYALADSGRVWRDPDGFPALEVEFRLDLGGVAVVGYIDQVWQWGTGQIGPRDLKTGTRLPGSPLQLGVYRVAVQELYGFLPAWGDFYMAKNNRPERPVDLSRYTREWVTSQFRMLEAGIRAESFLPNPGDGCRTCGVSEFCSAIGDPGRLPIPRKV